ncbi:MAG: hypothetical protein K2Y37_18800 [Pirellulales bacterium]|nr:hypothetical protein [Pirellulales bacterium]
MTKPQQPADSADSKRSGTFEELGRKLDDMPEVQRAEAALRAACDQLEAAQAKYRDVRDRAMSELTGARQKNFGDLLAGVLDFVRRNPGSGIIAAVLGGFFLGRLFRRR